MKFGTRDFLRSSVVRTAARKVIPTLPAEKTIFILGTQKFVTLQRVSLKRFRVSGPKTVVLRIFSQASRRPRNQHPLLGWYTRKRFCVFGTNKRFRGYRVCKSRQCVCSGTPSINWFLISFSAVFFQRRDSRNMDINGKMLISAFTGVLNEVHH